MDGMIIYEQCMIKIEGHLDGMQWSVRLLASLWLRSGEQIQKAFDESENFVASHFALAIEAVHEGDSHLRINSYHDDSILETYEKSQHSSEPSCSPPRLCSWTAGPEWSFPSGKHNLSRRKTPPTSAKLHIYTAWRIRSDLRLPDEEGTEWGSWLLSKRAFSWSPIHWLHRQMHNWNPQEALNPAHLHQNDSRWSE